MKTRLRLTILSITVLLLAFSIAERSCADQPYDIWFGTGPNNAGSTPGIYHATFDQDEGKLSVATLKQALEGAGWVTLHPNLPVLYSTCQSEGTSLLTAFQINADRSLKKISETPIVAGSCYIGIDASGQLLASAQYGGGNIITLALNDDGSFTGEPRVLQHTGGSKVVPGRQDSPHPHYVGFSPDNRFAFVPDLGLDKMVRYRIEGEGDLKKRLVADGAVNGIAGGGPRHMKFHTEGQFAFLLNELKLSVSVFKYADGQMQLSSTVPTLDPRHKQRQTFNSASEVRVHPSGRFVYTANRGHDSISVFSFDASTGRLIRQQIASVHGSWPRNFNLTPDGKWLIAAGGRSNSATVFAIDSTTGQLTYQMQSVFVPGPICVAIR